MSELIAERGVKIKYHYVPSAENMADLVSRGVSATSFQTSIHKWLHGPAWMLRPLEEWPRGQLGCVPSEFVSEGVVATMSEVPLSQFLNRFKS